MAAARAAVRGRLCEVCRRPMLAGQRSRHYVCSPPLPCCGVPADLAPDDHEDSHLDDWRHPPYEQRRWSRRP